MKDFKNFVIFFLILAFFLAISWRSSVDTRKEVMEEYELEIALGKYWYKAQDELYEIAKRLDEIKTSDTKSTMFATIVDTYDDLLTLIASAP